MDKNLLITVKHNKTYKHKHEKKKLLRSVTTDQSRCSHTDLKGKIKLALRYYHCEK